ncbi:hypothetical protein D9757_007989 [Collybiopsis confluens]|uniref:Cdc23 domain-containing protein n=1 Tax=Collybiopsis confluens TaxID=2823264 RepID=A0A8H5H5W7_9AGAR|nr:hypothetical protein D9757_007989 [Collybiopsis confluens]
MNQTLSDTDIVQDLRNAVRECSNRGLLAATKWCWHLNCFWRYQLPKDAPRHSLPQPPQKTAFDTFDIFQRQSEAPHQDPSQPTTRHPHAPPLAPFKYGPDHLDIQDEDALTSARICFEAKEYSRVPALVADCVGPAARFMSMYSRFLVSEHIANLEWHKYDDTRQQPFEPQNSVMQELLQEIINETDPWLLFLKAVFLSRLSRREEAIEGAILSIAGFPWNWSAWVLLTSCITDNEELTALLPLLPLPLSHPLVQMFQLNTLNGLHSTSDNEISICDRLLGREWFPGSLWLMTQRATTWYHLHDFASAEAQFDRILQLDPYRIDDIDVLSNILYVTNNRLKLTRLANDFLALDKDRPEVCCLVGNHYSLRAEHVKAIKYFRRATQLDRTYLSAWTLMGHEYVEIKNSHAAIDAYRRAVNVNRKDYRAWYGLGQAYELLNMHEYALHYYQYATALRPYDVRLWQAQGLCYEEMGRLHEAVECLKRALIPADPHEININLMLAKLHRDLSEHAEAAAYHRRVVEVCQADLRPVQDYAKSAIEVAAYQLKIPDGDLDLAQDYLQRVASSNAEDVVRAQEMLKTVNLTIQEKLNAAAAAAAAAAETSGKASNVTAESNNPGK